MEYGCGQCMPCRISRRRLWTHRLLLESYCHEHSTFATLTYDPKIYDGPTLVPVHYQSFLKTLRSRLHPLRVRFFLVGEYGEISQRPHYHAILFGVGLHQTELVRETWGMGHTMLGTVTAESIQYVAGYVTKKMTSPDDPRLNGRYPEFARMSLKPGIGALAVPQINEVLSQDAGADYLLGNGDVFNVLRHGKRILPLGRYLKSKLRKEYGFEDSKTPKEVISKISEEKATLHELQREDALTSGKTTTEFYRELSATKNQRILNLTTRTNVRDKKGIL